MEKREVITRRIRIYGIVQGVGFRPAVSRMAADCGIAGSVCNRGAYVEVYAQGTENAVSRFIAALQENPPVRADILKLEVCGVQDGRVYHGFSIIESKAGKGEIFISPDIAVCDDCARELMDPANRRYLHPFINCTACGPRLTILDSLPYDRERTSMKIFPMCPACAAEYKDPSSRRYDAQPVCCNACGPEVYLLEKNAAARGRLKTAAARAGKASEESRRDPACQENEFAPDGSVSEKTAWVRTCLGGDAISRVRQVIMDGGIAAVKGIGGFHLCCDAKNDAAVQRLRTLKHRPAKPFAVMMRDIDTAAQMCEISGTEREILTGHRKPILLLRRREAEGTDAVAPGNPKIGVMLPYAPVQILLFRYPDGIRMTDTLVMTSGNMSGAPICRTDEEAMTELCGCTDVILSNNRPINMRCDDSVMEIAQGRPYMIRRSRGYAPLPVRIDLNAAGHDAELPEKTRLHGNTAQDNPLPGCVLAIGGELKNTFCISRGNLLYLSPYVGDLSDARSGAALREAVRHFMKLLGAHPEAVIADLHPGYRSVRIAEEIARALAVPCVKVQHHYAHVLSCMAENDCMEPVAGVSFDGTGYGTDGTVWGGEIMIADVYGFTRAASIAPFWQIGGDAAAKEGWRVAGAMICALAEHGTRKETPEKLVEALGLCDAEHARVLSAMYKNKINSIISTSCGRLFDAAAAVLGICRESSYEGEAASQLMFAAERYAEKTGEMPEGTFSTCEAEAAGKRRFAADTESAARMPEGVRGMCGEKAGKKNNLRDRAECRKKKVTDGQTAGVRNGEILHMRTDLLVRDLIEKKLAGADTDLLAFYFHRQLAEEICRCLERLRGAGGNSKKFPSAVCLTGGCFQNSLLLGLTKRRLEDAGFNVLTHSLVPPNDGGLSLGQAFYGMFQRKM